MEEILKCQFCNKETNKLYTARFTDDPEDIGYDLEVCSECYPYEDLE